MNSYPSGLVITLHDQCRGLPARHFDLRTRETREYLSAHGRSFTVLEGCRDALERQLSKVHQDGALSSTVLYFGTTADPFFAFHKRFAITTQCLQAFERYQPGLLVLQTRSPMAIAALPTLHLLRERSVVVVPIESHLERSIARYTPGQPKIGERLVLAQGLRRQGIKVAISVSPVLPYGEYHRDAWEFADLLNRYADYISLGCLASGRPSDEKELKALAMARTLAADEQFHWLRPGAHEALFHAVNAIAPQKLLRPAVPGARVSQMSLFAAA